MPETKDGKIAWVERFRGSFGLFVYGEQFPGYWGKFDAEEMAKRVNAAHDRYMEAERIKWAEGVKHE